MRHFNGIIESAVEPATTNLWIQDGVLKYFRNGKWTPISGQGEADEQGLEEEYSYGVMWDDRVADPHITRIGNLELHKTLPIQSQYRGCVAKGGVINYYLDPDDWSKKEDGSPSILDGTDGTVKVHTPKFYGKSGGNNNYKWVRISTVKIDDTWTEIPEMLIDAYRSTVMNSVPTNKGYLSTLPANSAVSVVNTETYCRGGNNNTSFDQYLTTDKFRTQLGKPRTSLSRATMRQYARNAGGNMLSYEAYKWIFYWAFVIEYANFNSQENYNPELTVDGYKQGGLGPGVTTMNGTNWSNYNGYNPLIPCGTGNELGNNTGVVSITLPATVINDSLTVPATTLQVNRYRGFLTPFGAEWLNVDGVIIQNDPESNNLYKNIYTCDNPDDFSDTITDKYKIVAKQLNTDGYIKKIYLGTTGEIVPVEVGGNTTTYKCDYSSVGNKTDNSLRTLFFGGIANDGAFVGLGRFYSYGGVGFANAVCGFLTSCYPKK